MTPSNDEIIEEIFADAEEHGEGEWDTIVLVADVLQGLDNESD